MKYMTIEYSDIYMKIGDTVHKHLHTYSDRCFVTSITWLYCGHDAHKGCRQVATGRIYNWSHLLCGWRWGKQNNTAQFYDATLKKTVLLARKSTGIHSLWNITVEPWAPVYILQNATRTYYYWLSWLHENIALKCL